MPSSTRMKLSQGSSAWERISFLSKCFNTAIAANSLCAFKGIPFSTAARLKSTTIRSMVSVVFIMDPV